MSEVRCPMCGKLNPEDLEVCQYCQARLKPLVLSPSPDEEPEQTGSASETPRQAGPPEEPESDWLASLRSDEDEAGEADSSIDWLDDDYEAGGEMDLPAEQPPNEVEGWLAGLRAGQEEAEELEPPEEPSALSRPPDDWFQEASSEPEAGDWLAEMRGTPQAGDELEAEARVPSGEDEEPEWLHRIRTRQSDEQGYEPPEPESGSQDAGDEADARAAGRQDFPAGPPEEAEELGAGLPEWESASPEPEMEIPDWMRGGEATELDEVEPEEPFEETSGELPDWLAQIEPEPGEARPQAGVEPGLASEQGEPQNVPPFTDETEFSEEHVSEGLTESGALQPAETGGEELPDWEAGADSDLDLDWLDATLREGGEPVTPKDGEKASPFVGEFPDLPADLVPGVEAAAETGDEPGLARADLPGWLEAMRPVEAAAPPPPLSEKGEPKIESSGPLAGLQGVLPAEADIARIKKPGTYTVKLQISDHQKSHIALLQELLEQEGEPRPAPAPVRISTPMLLRVLIFILIVAAILAPGFMDTPPGRFSAVPPETLNTSRMINDLPGNAPVLVAVDYDPGLTGELEAAAAPVLDHLMLKGAYLTLVSTSPTGPVQAERLVRTINSARGHQYQDEAQYANLGFIPGGATGLLAFAQTPQRVVPYSTIGSRIWDLPGLGQVSGLGDFSLAVVITDSPDKARAWIEQVQPALQDTPLAMVLSAQAEPMVRPYYSGVPRQVQGMVTGLAGGMAYETVISRSGRATETWDGFSLGVLMALALMILFGLLNVVMLGMAQRRPTERKGDV